MKSIRDELARELLAAYAHRYETEPSRKTELVVRPETTVITQGEVPGSAFIILQGSMKIQLLTAKGTEYLVAIEGPGELLGEIEALTGEKATCSIIAMTESKMAKISVSDYKKWLEEDHEFALLVNRIITYRLQGTTKRAATHLSYPLEYSVLKLLKLLAEENESHILKTSKEDIANYLGTSMRSINRIIKNLKNKQILKQSRELEILSMSNLDKAMAEYEK